MAGLCAARSLADVGHEVVVHEAANEVGGRLCTRRVGDATFDSGAQFFTVRSDEFSGLVDGWLTAGVVFEWCRGFGSAPDGYPRYAGRAGMADIAVHLATDLDVRLGSHVDDPHALDADAVVVTAPGAAVEWHRTIALLAVLDRSPGLPAPGAIQAPAAPFSFVADNQAKGISAIPAVTLHAGHRLSDRHWDDEGAVDALLTLAVREGVLGDAAVVDARIDRWAHAGPVRPLAERCVVVDERVVLAGDWCGGPKVEGAALSGRAAARAVTTRGPAPPAPDLGTGLA